MKKLFVAPIGIVLVSTTLLTACGPLAPFKPEKSISSISPDFVAVGRTKTVTIQGDFTKWQGATAADVSFGDGVTVDSIAIGNDQVLSAQITCAPDAAVGPRDVVVKGQHLDGIFEVKPVFELVNFASAKQGQYAHFFIQGYDTDWTGNSTVRISGGDAWADGTDPLGYSSYDNWQPDLMEVWLVVDPFAPAGARDVTIDGTMHTDTMKGALTIDALTPSTLPVGNTTLTLQPGEVRMLASPPGAVGDIDMVTRTGTGNLLLVWPFVDGDGAHPLGDLQDGASGSAMLFDAKNVVVVVQNDSDQQDYYPPAPIQVSLGYSSTATNPLTIASGSPLTTQQISSSAATPANYYQATGAPLQLNTVTVDRTGSSVINPHLTVFRRGRTQLDLNGSLSSTTWTFPSFLTGADASSLSSFFRITDNASNTDANSEYTLTWTHAPPAGQLFASADQDVGLLPAYEYGPTVSTTTVSTALQTISAVHVMVDVQTPYNYYLDLALISPDGTKVQLRNRYGYTETSNQDLLEAYPDLHGAAGNLAAFSGLNPNGVWKLLVGDYAGYGPDQVKLRGWALTIEGS